MQRGNRFYQAEKPISHKGIEDFIRGYSAVIKERFLSINSRSFC